jgi:predicted transposase YbfD/YdcC
MENALQQQEKPERGWAASFQEEGLMKVQPPDLRIQKLVDRLFKTPGYQWEDLTDPRKRRGRRWSLRHLINAAFVGLLANCPTLRDVEAMTEEMGPAGRKLVPRRVPDTTLWEVIARLDPRELRLKLQAQVRAAWRGKSLRPVGLPCGVIAIDGKGLGALEHDAEGTAQKAHRSHDGSPYWLTRALRAVLTSAQAKPCLDQVPVDGKTNEMASFAGFFDDLMRVYGAGDLFEVVTVDAGMVSRANADRVHNANKAYVMALKGTQPELLAEAQRQLCYPGRRPDCEGDVEVSRGRRVQRRLYKTTEVAGYHDWSHLRQIWRVEQETRDSQGQLIDREDRYFLTNLHPGRFTLAQILRVVREHWGVENDCFWSLDMQWREDAVPWCSQGRAVEVLSWFRLMAYNLLQFARRAHLRVRNPSNATLAPPPPWRRIFEWVRQAWRRPLVVEAETVCG